MDDKQHMENKEEIQFELIKVSICMGISCIISALVFLIVVFSDLKSQIEHITHSFRKEILVSSIFIIFGYILIFYGLVFFIAKNKKLQKNKSQIFITSLFFLYAFITTFLFTKDGVTDDYIIISLILWITGFLYLLSNLIVYGKNILFSTIGDPKDRITVVLAITGAIISLIALFK